MHDRLERIKRELEGIEYDFLHDNHMRESVAMYVKGTVINIRRQVELLDFYVDSLRQIR